MFWTTWQFLTIIPAPVRAPAGLEDLGRSTGLFPVVGLILGLLLFGLDSVLGLWLPPLLGSALVVVALIVLTGGVHLDGLIDTCDGFAVKNSKAERLATMRDSRVGGFGVIGGYSLIVVKCTALAALWGGMRSSGLVLMPALSRWGIVYAMMAFPAARRDGMGWTAKQTAGWKGMTVATAFVVVATVVVLGWWGVPLLAVLWLFVLGVSRKLSSRFGGLTGDGYGAICELSETAFVVLLVWMQGLGLDEWLAFL